MLIFRSNPHTLFLLYLFSLFLFRPQVASQASHIRTSHIPGYHKRIVFGEREHSEVLAWRKIERRNLAEGDEADSNNSSLILAEKRTHRKDPLNDFKKYTGGWNISNQHYLASVGFTAAPFFAIAAAWFILFALCLFVLCIRHCCCRLDSYGYSRTAYALSLIFLVLFTIAAIVGSIVLYIGQGEFHASTTNTLNYVVHKADVTAENLRNVSDYLSAAKKISVDSTILSPDMQKSIDDVDNKINSSASTLSTKAADNKDKIQHGLDGMRLELIIVAAVMLFLAFLGFLLSVLGLQCLVYTLVIFGWILVAGTFILCVVTGDACVAMDEWVQHPAAHTALDDILPCVDNATAQETLLQTKNVSRQLVNVVNGIINNVANRDFPPQLATLYYNQSGPLVPVLCNPFHSDLTERLCTTGEVSLFNSSEVWKKKICNVSASTGICNTPGRLTPKLYSQMSAAVNVSYGLYRYGPFLVNLQDCTFVRDTFTDISHDHCPGLRRYSKWIYIGLVLASTAVMLSLIFWVIYARERRHRVYTKQQDARSEGADKGQ
ncbi:PLATZ transcription factor family protein [Hibiscus syriacus]|uniref:PLATZ transcription factor family protein n=1 Tax=Hibiscus syriacus TaxID=106335 RepID=A0A6A3D0Z5_HIBSY|nr:PLATZ transcription factor family protein [Hibiscus syriacus]